MQKIIYGVYPILKISVFSILILASCSSFLSTKNVSLSVVDFESLDLDKVQFRKSLDSFLNSCLVLSKYEGDYQISRKFVTVKIVDYRLACEQALRISDGLTRQKFEEFLKEYFKVYEVNNVQGTFLTGYFLPEIEVSFEPSDVYKYPIYKTPATLNNIKHLLSRKNIADGALEHLNLEIAWAKNEIDLFFLHIQGSGVLKLANGERYLLSYDKSNGHKYYSIGKYFKEHGILDDINAYSIKEWLRNHPEEKEKILNLNASFIFFRLSKQISGGSGSVLTSNASLAIDTGFYPYGLPVLIETKVPDYYNKGKKKEYSNIMVMQDTGSDIIGGNRGDIYFGHGKEAEYQASMMKNYGKMYVFVPNSGIVH